MSIYADCSTAYHYRCVRYRLNERFYNYGSNAFDVSFYSTSVGVRDFSEQCVIHSVVSFQTNTVIVRRRPVDSVYARPDDREATVARGS